MKSKFNSHLKSILHFDENIKVEEIDALNLLTPSRLDIVAKKILVDHWLRGIERASWASLEYKEHLKVWSQFHEEDSSGKSSYEDFEVSFKAVFRSIREHGFSKEESIIPIDKEGKIIDGAHRTAIAISLKKKVFISRFEHVSASYDAQYFLKIGLQKAIVETLVAEYCRLKKNVRVAVLFPVADDKNIQVQNHMNSLGKIVYEKRIKFSSEGKANLIKVLYDGEDWLNIQDSEKTGLMYHTESRFNGKPVRFVIFETNDHQALDYKKSKIREVCAVGNNSIHINDYHSQTVFLTDLILNPNGLLWLNRAKLKNTPKFDFLFNTYSKVLMNLNKDDREGFCLDGSAVLALHGLRDVSDLDYIFDTTNVRHEISPSSELICNNHCNLYLHKKTAKELIYNPKNHFRYKQLKVITLDILKSMKENRNGVKDIYDIELIKSIASKQPKKISLQKVESFIRYKCHYYKLCIFLWLSRNLPSSVKFRIKRVISIVMYLSSCLGPRNRKISYLRFNVDYSSGTSLIDEIRRNKLYEPTVTSTLIDACFEYDKPIVLDVGANIGLISLNLIDALNDVTIYAFEPGKHQFEYLCKNITQNNLNKRVFPCQVALGEETETKTFFTHSSRHVSGDGFFDTKRAGKTYKTEVEVIKLDEWWEVNNKPAISVIKIDTEGAELMVLRGATKVLEKLQPKIIFELNEENIKPYPYQAVDLLLYLNDNRYDVMTLGEGSQRVTSSNIHELMQNQQDFLATPVLQK